MHYRVYVCDVCVLTAVLCITEDFFVDVVSSPELTSTLPPDTGTRL